MNSRESLKLTLENFSTEREFSFVYKEKTQIIIKKYENSNDYYFEGKFISILPDKLFKENEIESTIKSINELISKNNFSIAVKIKSPPAAEIIQTLAEAEIFQTLAKILLEKVAHIEDDHFRTSKYGDLSEADEKRLLKAHNYSKIFCRYVDDVGYYTETLSYDYAASLLGECFSEKYDRVDSTTEHIKAEITFSPTTNYSHALYFIVKHPLLQQLTANNITVFVKTETSVVCA